MSPSQETPDKAPFVLQTQQFDGVSMALCQELGVIRFHPDSEKAKSDLYKAIVSNARIVRAKQREQLDREEQLIFDHADKIFENQANLSRLFRIVDLNRSQS